MKWNGMIAAGVVALFLTTACDKSSDAKATASVGDKSVDVDVSYAKKDDWVSKMKSQANDLSAEIQRLSTNTSEEAKSKLETLKEKSKNLNVEIDKAQNSTESTWSDVKTSSKKAMDEASDSFRDAKDWVAKKLQQAGDKLESK
jgi:uncharacterized lipoprotein YehR (DUF1307 family)